MQDGYVRDRAPPAASARATASGRNTGKNQKTKITVTFVSGPFSSPCGNGAAAARQSQVRPVMAVVGAAGEHIQRVLADRSVYDSLSIWLNFKFCFGFAVALRSTLSAVSFFLVHRKETREQKRQRLQLYR